MVWCSSTWLGVFYERLISSHEVMHFLLLYFHIHWQLVSPLLDHQNGLCSMMLFAAGVCLNSSMFTLQKDKGWEVMKRHFPRAPNYEFSRKKPLWLGAELGPSCVSCLHLRGAFFRSVYVSVCGGSGLGPRLVRSGAHICYTCAVSFWADTTTS